MVKTLSEISGKNKILLLVIGWYFFWLLTINLIEQINLSIYTNIIISIALLALFVGGLVGEKFSKNDRKIMLGDDLLSKIFSLILIIQFSILIVAVYFIVQSGIKYDDYRQLLFYNSDEIFKYKIIIFLYVNIVFPIGVYLSFSFIDLREKVEKKVYLFFFINGLILLNRISLYMIIFYFIINIFSNKIIYSKKKIFIYFLIIILIMGSIISLRSNENFDNLYENFLYNSYNYGIIYHIVGISNFNQFINGLSNFESEGFLFCGFICSSIQILFNYLGVGYGAGYWSNFLEYGIYLQDNPVLINDFPYVAYATSFLPYYLDFGVIGLTIAFFIFGFILCWSRSRSSPSPLGKLTALALFMSLFQSLMIESFYLVPLFLAFLLYLYRLFKPFSTTRITN